MICQQKGLIFLYFAILHKNRHQNRSKIIQFSATKTFDFSTWTLYNVPNIKKGFDEDGQTAKMRREPVVGANRRFSV